MRELMTIWCFLCVLTIVNGLGCFKCDNQGDNKGKCVTTTYTCAPNQDTCVSLIEWKTPPYWTKHGERMYQISKGCETSSRCQDLRAQLRTKCKRDWYNDWMCIECCTGDLCNRYVTLGSGSIRGSILTLFTSCILVLAVHLYH